jgi:hypothetical protein
MALTILKDSNESAVESSNGVDTEIECQFNWIMVEPWGYKSPESGLFNIDIRGITA